MSYCSNHIDGAQIANTANKVVGSGAKGSAKMFTEGVSDLMDGKGDGLRRIINNFWCSCSDNYQK